MGQTDAARNEFLYVLEKMCPNDSYSFLGLANIWYKQAMDTTDNANGEQDKLLVKAYNKYLEILYHDQSNCYACVGLANILAYFNKTEDALEIFKLIGNANPGLSQPLLNQAHLSVGQQNYELSINLYQKVLEKQLPNDLKTQMYLAKAYYQKGDFESSKRLTIELLAKHPNHIPLKFNLALCLFQQADKIFNLEVRRVKQTEEAINYLKQSLKLFSWVRRQFDGAYSFSKTTELTKEAREKISQDYNQMLRIAETKSFLIEDMIQSSEQQLVHDREQEARREN